MSEAARRAGERDNRRLVDDVRVLGPVEVVADDGPVRLTAKHRRLLAALLVANGRACSVDDLVEAVWTRSPPDSARKLVQVYVSQLRGTLPRGLDVVTHGGAYASELGSGRLDAARFERLLRECELARQHGNAPLAASLADQALALWRGRAYGELAYEEFARTESERLEELRLVALEQRLDAWLALGRHAEVLGEALAVAEENPFRERAQELVMLALYRCGRQTDALDRFIAVRARLRNELGLEPGTGLRELQRRILEHDPTLEAPAAVAVAEGPIPVPPTPLVGRGRELERLRAILGRREARLLVLTGAGGSGKTRLALEAACEAASSFANGAVLVELAPLRESELVVAALAQALDVAEAPDEPLEDTLARALAPREVLLVVDNAEHVRDAAPLFSRLAALAPRLTVLVTSRAVLHVSGEHVFPVAPLSEDDAVELFRQRAGALDPSFELSDTNEPDIREICRRLDQLPLAIELAAAWIRTLTPKVLRERLDARLGMLAHGPRDLPARQQTLRDTIDWSVQLLRDDERRALGQLSVFPAGASLDVAEIVCGASLDVLSSLVDHSLVQRAERGGMPRLSLLETIHEYAADLFAADPAGVERTRRRHVDWCRRLVEEAEPHWSGDRQVEWLELIEGEHDNLRAALDYLDEAGDLESLLSLSSLLGRFWYVRGYILEGRRRLEAALAHAAGEPPGKRRRAFTAAAALAHLHGDHEAATRFAEQALDAARATGEQRFVANGVSNLGAIVLAAGDHTRAESALEEAVRLARGAGDERILALATNNRADLALTVGDYELAGPLFAESLDLLRARGDAANIARSLFNNGAVDLMQDRVAEAAERFREGLKLAHTTGDREDLAWLLLGLAATEVENGACEPGARLLGAARGILAQMSAAFKPFERELDRRTEERSRALCGDRQHDAAVARGLSLTVDEALELALGPGALRQ